PPPTPVPSPLSLHDALPIYPVLAHRHCHEVLGPRNHGENDVPIGEPGGRIHDDRPMGGEAFCLRAGAVVDGYVATLLEEAPGHRDRKSTRLNSSHSQISYAV